MRAIVEYIDLLADFYGAPVEQAGRLARDAPIGLGVLCFLLFGATLIVAHAFRGGSSEFLFKLLPWGAVVLLSGLIPLVLGYLLAGILHLTAELLGARQGSAAAMFVLLGLCQLLYVLYLPVVLTTEVFSEDPGALRACALLAIGALSLALKVASVRGNYGLGAGRALAVLLFPYASALGLAAVGLAAMVGSALHLGRLFN